MAQLSIRKIFERASKLNDKQLARLLEDLPINVLIKLENIAISEQLAGRSNNVCKQIIEASSKRVK